MEESSSIAVLVPNSRGQEAVLIPDSVVGSRLQDNDGKQKQKATDSLIQVIEKLSKIVENKRKRRCTLAGKKRPHLYQSVVLETKENCEIPAKMAKDSDTLGQNVPSVVQEEYYLSEDLPDTSSRTVTCYQCSLCKFISPTLPLLKEHIRLHDRQNEVILMCSECCFMSKRQEELEAHVKIHLDSEEMHTSVVENHELQNLNLSAAAGKGFAYAGGLGSLQINMEDEEVKGNLESSVGDHVKKKWYTYEQYGMYRCLICSYTCGQQRMLKTHAWKHAGEVDCSYPIFEDELEPTSLPAEPLPQADEAVVVLAPVSKPADLYSTPPFHLQLCTSATDDNGKPIIGQTVQQISEEVCLPKVASATSQEEVVEEQAVADLEQDNATSDSLLSSAQKIISCSPNRVGHVNVIVERLPGAEEVGASKQFLMSPDIEKRLISDEPEMTYYEDTPEVYNASKGTVAAEEVIIDCCTNEKQCEDKEAKESTVADENAPPVRRRTHSESLRLHSLAAEVLVAMPTRTPVASIKSIVELSTQSPDTGQRYIDITNAVQHKVISAINNTSEDFVDLKRAGTAPVDLELQKVKPGLSEVPVRMGISMSLLTVIEKLRERTDQNTSDEDILKELQDNAQCQLSSDASLPGGNLVEYIPESDRPYRCRLCLYTSGNKGYIKQHLRVHRQRQPYQCPICEHIAEDSKDLENHMINHCKTRMYHCKQCEETFYYKSQLRNHEREQHGLPDTLPALSSVNESIVPVAEESEDKYTEEDLASTQKVYKCDVCAYTSSTYIGVRNHRRIHNSDKPYRCSSCDFATTNMNSLKSHMRRHPQEHQAVQLMEQYQCSLCGYVCSHPPSLKSHMWKHAGDQNYNYEQVNKAINEAISQSSRSQCPVPKMSEPVERAMSGLAEKLMLDPETPSLASEEDTGVIEPSQVSSSTTKTSSEKSVSQSRAGSEYCVLLFCCCICGFESTSKEHLMEHMKKHEGEIINIILNRERSSQEPQRSTQ
ncbi:zinc finger protein 507-like [Polyodon spathula]|uniref:zinc finger protein 507-like n=1 Tax=Polyodon spathula TaxID=7913 RepID=UPI001B7ED35C|nr:zinc finger protein 507-like [Polyodon spathula]